MHTPKNDCCIRAFAVVAITVVIFCILGLSIEVYPSDPKIHVDSIVVSPFNVSDTSVVTANWDVDFSIRNPNTFRTRFIYQQIDLSVYYKTEFLTGTNMKPFVQHGKNDTSLKASSAVLEKRFDDWVSASMAEDWKRGSVDFDVTLHGWVDCKYGLWRRRWAWMEASCPDITVRFSSINTTTAGTMLGGSRRCKASVQITNSDDRNHYHHHFPHP